MREKCTYCKDFGIHCEDRSSFLNIPIFPPPGRIIFIHGLRPITGDPIFRCYPLHHPDSREEYAKQMKIQVLLTAHGATQIYGRDPSIPMEKKETF